MGPAFDNLVNELTADQSLKLENENILSLYSKGKTPKTKAEIDAKYLPNHVGPANSAGTGLPMYLYLERDNERHEAYRDNHQRWRIIGAQVERNLDHCKQELEQGRKEREDLLEMFKQALLEIEEEVKCLAPKPDIVMPRKKADAEPAKSKGGIPDTI